LTGWNVYREDELLFFVPISETEIPRDYDLPVGIHMYYLTAVYTAGESEPVIARAEVFYVSDTDAIVEVNTTELIGSFPNPFNPSTEIRFEVQGSRFVKIEVYNIRGQVVRTLVNDYFPAGRHSVEWNGTDDRGRTVGSGIYFYRMTAGEFSETRRMLLMK